MIGGAPVARRNRLIVRSLWRDDLPEARAATAERALLRTIGEWPAGAGIDMVARSTTGSRVEVDVVALGDVPAEWQADVALALGGIGTVAATARPRRPLEPSIVAELVRDRADVRAAPEGSVTAPSWPRGEREGATPLLEALREIDGGFVRMLVAAAGPLERSMLDDDLFGPGGTPAEIAAIEAYRGTPVLARAFIGIAGCARGVGAGFAPLRAAVRSWGIGLRLADAEGPRFDEAASVNVRGAVRPEGWGLALLRLPASGRAPILAMPTSPRPVPDRPIDVAGVPRRSVASIDLGTARVAGAGTTRVRVAVDDLLRHAFVEGRSGAGKTTLLSRMAVELAAQGVGFTLLEHHGSGVDEVLRALPDEQSGRVRVVRHGDLLVPAPLNLLAEPDPDAREQAVSEFVELVQSMFDPRGEGIVGPRWRRWFGLLVDGVCAWFGPRATLLHVLAVASDLSRVNALAARLASTEPELSHRLRSEIGMLRGEEAVNVTSWALSKFQPLVGQRAMREIVGRAEDCVDVVQVMDDAVPLLVDLAGPTLGTASARTLGALWLLKHLVALGRRRDRRPHILLVDEAHLYTFGALPTLLAEARKFGVGVIVATQSFDSLTPAMQVAVEANVGSTFSFRLGLHAAPRSSIRLAGWPVDELVRLPDRSTATSLSRAGVQQDPFLLRVARSGGRGQGSHDRVEAADARNAQLLREMSSAPAPTDQEVVRALHPSEDSSPRRADRVLDRRRAAELADLDEEIMGGPASDSF